MRSSRNGLEVRLRSCDIPLPPSFGVRAPFLLRTIAEHTVSLRKKEYPLELVAYAHRNGHSDVLDLTAPFTIAKPQNEVRNKFPPVLFTAWVRLLPYHASLVSLC